jgi:predicted DNA-binding antitoxin AbrB/MazE fold protein
MTKNIPAVYEQGVFRPLEPVELEEGQSVTLAIDPGKRKLEPDQMLALARKVYAGLTQEQVEQVEAIALDRSQFFSERTEG